MIFRETDPDLQLCEIIKLVAKNDHWECLRTRRKYWNNYVEHFLRLMDAGQVCTFRKRGQLVGFCSYLIVDDESKKEINKTTWKLPKEVNRGNILYVDVCVLSAGSSIWPLKKLFYKKFRPTINRVYWFSMPNNKIFDLNYERGQVCLTAV